MDENREQSPYHGLWVGCLAMIAVPFAFYFIISGIIFEYEKNNTYIFNAATSRLFGFGLGTVFHLTCALCGAFTPSFNAIVKRVKEFFSNLIVSVPFAIKNYWLDIKRDGVVFIIYLAIMVLCAAVWIDALLEVFEILERTVY